MSPLLFRQAPLRRVLSPAGIAPLATPVSAGTSSVGSIRSGRLHTAQLSGPSVNPARLHVVTLTKR